MEPEITRQGCRDTSELGPSDRPGPEGVNLGGSQAAFAKRFPAHGSPPDAAKKKRDIGNTWEPVKRVVEDVSLFLLLRSTSTLCTRVGKGKTKTKGKSDSAKDKGSTEVQGIFRML